jgi:hypothetical protein
MVGICFILHPQKSLLPVEKSSKISRRKQSESVTLRAMYQIVSAELLWPTFLNILKFGSAAYVLAKGLIGTLRDLCDFAILVLSD